ncbi:MAG: translation initiation factor IF-2 [Planctomycetota bacterium]
MAKTLRVHSLAKQLGVSSKQVIEKCHAEGIELKNHMAAISVGLAESIQEWFSVGEDVTTIEVAEKVDLSKVRKPTRRKTKTQTEVMGSTTAVAEPEPEAPLAPVPSESPEETVTEQESVPSELVAPVEVQTATPEGEVAEVLVAPAATEAPPAESKRLQPAASTQVESEVETEEPPTPPEQMKIPVVKPPQPPEVITPAGPQVVPAPAELKGPRVVRIEAPDQVRAPRPRTTPAARTTATESTSAPSAAPRHGRGRRPSAEDREGAARSRSPRRYGHVDEVGEREKEWRDQDLIERRERLAAATGHGLRERRAAERRRQAVEAASSSPVARKATVEITTPIMLKDFCSALGSPFALVSRKLVEHTDKLWTINQVIDAEIAELLAMDLGVLVKIAKQKTAFEKLCDEFAQRECQNLQPRPPVVAMLGHVDHGKTSLLDAIRAADVAGGESGGITQHIGAYRLERDGWKVTFLDTPGHEAFTAMRARGANLTDVVVLVVAADDGVMPQTVEAINHAKAAGVQIVVALNKIDLLNVDLNRIYAQLAEHELAPTEWGGETDVIKTSAQTGEGIEDLLAHLSTLSDLLDLKADPQVPVEGTVIEAQMREGHGVVTQVLVRNGTLRTGQIIVCGGGVGRVRLLRDDRNRRVKEALPGWPVEVVGLDVLPEAGDRLFQVNDLKLAKDIAEEIRQKRRTASLESARKPLTLEQLLAGDHEGQIPELNVIVKADVQGSVDVLKKSLSEFPTEKAHLRILHAAVGAISEADVNLARASNAIVIGFHVVAEDHARQLADQLGVELRPYRVIYEILDDMNKALAGLLEPIEKEEVRGAVEVRQVFHVSRVGTVAGCSVSNGIVARKHRLRVVRDGRVITEGRAVQSLKRFKDDVREVRAGFECGIKLEGFDDVKPGDVIEAYEVVEIAQEL